VIPKEVTSIKLFDTAVDCHKKSEEKSGFHLIIAISYLFFVCLQLNIKQSLLEIRKRMARHHNSYTLDLSLIFLSVLFRSTILCKLFISSILFRI
jgi:hypothetical protein